MAWRLRLFASTPQASIWGIRLECFSSHLSDSALIHSTLVFLQNFFWPVLLGISPGPLRRWIQQHVSSHEEYFRPEVQAMLSNLPRFLPDSDLERAARQLRLSHLMDRSAPYHLPASNARILREALVHGEPPAPGQASLILGAHYGCAWWLLPWLAQSGRPVHFVTAPPATSLHWTDWLTHPLSRWRWHCLAQAGRQPLILMRGASRAVRSSLSSGGCVNALIDIPPTLAKRCSSTSFLGRQAWMPMQLIRVACETHTPVWFCCGYWDSERDVAVLEFESLQGSAEEIFQGYAALLEHRIHQEPGRWHCWGHVDDFFSPTDPGT